MEAQQQLDIETDERKVTRTVNVKLQPAEKAECMNQYNQLRDEMDAEEKEFSSVKDAHKAKISDLEAKAEKVRLRAKNGDPRNEECIEKRFYGTNTIQVWYGEEMIEERAMTVEERQMDINDVQHGVVMEAEEDSEPLTEEEQRADIANVIQDETRRVDAPNLREIQ